MAESLCRTHKKGLAVYLVNGKLTETMNLKKADGIDCQCLPAVCLRRSYSIGATRLWQSGIQKLHSLGLLNRCFLPDSSTEALRTLCRQRSNIIACKADATRKVQKFLTFRLDVVVSDITGQTGIAIIEAIGKGEFDPKILATKRHDNCRKSEGEISRALVGNNQKHYHLGSSQELDRYKFYIQQMHQRDLEIASLLNTYLDTKKNAIDELPRKKPCKRLNKHSI